MPPESNTSNTETILVFLAVLCPHDGQLLACSEIFFPHASHLVKVMGYCCIWAYKSLAVYRALFTGCMDLMKLFSRLITLVNSSQIFSCWDFLWSQVVQIGIASFRIPCTIPWLCREIVWNQHLSVFLRCLCWCLFFKILQVLVRR